MATYVPNATQTSEPVESQTVESAALEFRTLKTRVNALAASVTADDLTDLRVPEASVAVLPAVAERAGKVLGFDAGGDPTMVEVAGATDPSLRSDLAASSGASLVGFDPTLNYAVATIGHSMHHINVKMFPWLAKGDGVTDDRAAIQAAITRAHSLGGGFDIEFPDGDYLINGVASSDTFLSGLVVPFDGFVIDKRIKLVATGNARLKCGSNDMILVRASRPGTQLLGLQLNGNSKTNVWGIGAVAEDRTQVITLVSQSYCKVDKCHVQGFTEGLVLEPGPTVEGSQSGAFYPVITNSDFNLNARSMWFKPSPHDDTNRPTRGNIAFNRIERGNCGIDLDYATEFNLYGNNFQFFKSTYSTTPIATACAIHLGPLSEGNNLYGGEAEACDADINNESTFANALYISGFSLNGVNVNVGRLGTTQRQLMRVVPSTGAPEQLAYVYNYDTFVKLVADYEMSGSKTLDVVTNGVRRFGWFNGTTTHYGTTGNIALNNAGSAINFSAGTSTTIGSPVGATHYNNADAHFFRSAGGVSVTRMANTGTLAIFPGSDNAILMGNSANRWSAVWAANGTIQTSDPRTKTKIVNSPLGLDFINSLRPVAYKFIVGGNKIVGVREVTPAVMRIDEETGLEVVDVPAITENIVEAQPGNRQHFGFLTTEVKVALGAVDFGGYIKTDLNDPESEEALRYEEFIAPIVRAIQELSAEFNAYKLAHP